MILGTMADFINGGGTLAYGFYKAFVPSGNAAAAAAIKLFVRDDNTAHSDKFGSFIYEPYLNGPSPVPAGQWANESITGTSGKFWTSGIYDQPKNLGFTKTLAAWLLQFNNDFLDADIIGISVGVGSGNQGQEAYFDNILFSNGSINTAYDFELQTSTVPVPAALPLLGTGLALMGFMGWRRKRQQA